MPITAHDRETILAGKGGNPVQSSGLIFSNSWSITVWTAAPAPCGALPNTAKRNGRDPLALFASVLLHGADTPATELYGAGCDSS